MKKGMGDIAWLRALYGAMVIFAGFRGNRAPHRLVGKHCRLELDNGAGATMRVQLVGYDAADLEALSRSFWNAL